MSRSSWRVQRKSAFFFLKESPFLRVVGIFDLAEGFVAAMETLNLFLDVIRLM